MTSPKPNPVILMMLALAGWPVAVSAEEISSDEEVARLIYPESSVRLGLRRLDGNALRFGQFLGLNEAGTSLQLDMDLVSRDEATGTWLRFKGNNLTQDHRDLRAEFERQGAWKYTFDISRIPRHVPLEFVTGLTGIGSASQQVNVINAINGAAPPSIELGTTREIVKLGAQQFWPDAIETQWRFRQEHKLGARPSSVQGITFITEPIDFTSKEMEASLAYNTKDLQLNGGYLGSWFGNHNKINTVIGATVDDLSPAQISLPLDNAAHMFYMSGGYALSPTARATFKVSFERSTQNEPLNVPSSGTLLAEQHKLGGKVDTTLLHAGVSGQVTGSLAMLANLRYEDRDDKTPRHQYLTPEADYLHALNSRYSRNTLAGKLEGTYRWTKEYSATAGVDYDRRRRGVPPSIPYTDAASPAQSRQVSARSETDETGVRIELKRGLGDEINGSIAYVKASRRGSAYLPADNDPAPDLVAPIHWSDREREKWRLSLDWVPLEPLSVQIVVEDADDR